MTRESMKGKAKEGRATITEEKSDEIDIIGLVDKVFERVPTAFPPPKKQLTIRLDEDVLTWLKGQGRGYQTRINSILRAYYDAYK